MQNAIKLSVSEQNSKNASGKKASPKQRAQKTPRSFKLAIAAYCYHECHGETKINSHTTKYAIKNCEKTNCSLHLHRGFQKLV